MAGELIKLEAPTLKAASAAFGEKIARSVMADSMNRTAKQATNVVAEAASDYWNVKKTAVKRTIILVKAVPQTLTGELIATSKKIPLIGFKGTRQNKRGLRVEVRRGKAYTMRSRFVTKVGTGRGHKGGFERYGPKRIMSAGTYAGQLRQPIRELYGPSLSQTIEDPQVIERLIDFYNETLPVMYGTRLHARINFLIKKATGL